jgi:hypothetical protein
MNAYGRSCSSHDSAETGAGAGVGFVFALGLLVLTTLLFQLFARFPLVVCVTCTQRHEAARHAARDEHMRQIVISVKRDLGSTQQLVSKETKLVSKETKLVSKETKLVSKATK